MSDEVKPKEEGESRAGSPSTRPGEPRQSVEQISALLEGARQAVKPIVKRELEGEVVAETVLGFRLRRGL